MHLSSHSVYNRIQHAIYNSLHLIVSNSNSVVLPLLGNHKSVLYICEPISVS